MRRLDELQTAKENKANRTARLEGPVFPNGAEGAGRSYEDSVVAVQGSRVDEDMLSKIASAGQTRNSARRATSSS